MGLGLYEASTRVGDVITDMLLIIILGFCIHDGRMREMHKTVHTASVFDTKESLKPSFVGRKFVMWNLDV